MNAAHLHLLLNHFPTIGAMIGIVLLATARVRRNADLTTTSLIVLFLIGLFTIPAYMSGNAAQRTMTTASGLSPDVIVRHQDAALIALVGMMVTSLAAWFVLWQERRGASPTAWPVSAVLVLGIITIALAGNASTLGGEIRHPEIAVGWPSAPDYSVGVSARVADFVVSNGWVWPVLETLHFIGLSLLAGVLLVANLRLLGFMKHLSFAGLHALLPWAVLGFLINTVSGTLFFVTAPDQYTPNPAFFLKMLFIFLAGGNLIYLTVFDSAWVVRSGDDPPIAAKAAAIFALVLWTGVICWGRLMPFLGLSF